MRRAVCVLGVAALALVLAGSSARAWADENHDGDDNHEVPCDFLTGGGFIFRFGAKANFGVGGGCKHGSPTWGHLQYNDHGNGLNVHWKTITAYFPEGETGVDSRNQPIGTRWICGKARSNHFGDVDFAVRASDFGEPGVHDEFDLWLRDQDGVFVYSTTDDGTFPHKLGGGGPGGGNIQLHKPNPSTTGEFGGDCPAYPF